MSTSIVRIGILSPVTEAGMKDCWGKLKEGLEELGYVEGRNIEFVWRFADGKFECLPGRAIELAKLGVDVLMPATPPAIDAAKSASSSIPIVFPLGSDPVETGLVSSLELIRLRPLAHVGLEFGHHWRDAILLSPRPTYLRSSSRPYGMGTVESSA